MKHAFMILAHKNYHQIKLLIDSLSFGDIYIHIDLKNEELYSQLKKNIQYENVFIISNRVSVNWSGVSQIYATLHLIESVIDSKKQYDYIHLISGQDFILVNNKNLDDFLLSYGNDKIFIEYDNIGLYRWRVKKYSFFRENPKNRTIYFRIVDIFLRLLQCLLPERNNLKEYDLYKGSQWFSVTNECLQFIFKNSKKILKDFKYTACSDEHFFQILVLNSYLKDKVVNSNGRFIVFDRGKASPKILTVKDYDSFMNGEYIFARKFDLSIDEDIIYKIKNKIK